MCDEILELLFISTMLRASEIKIIGEVLGFIVVILLVLLMMISAAALVLLLLPIAACGIPGKI